MDDPITTWAAHWDLDHTAEPELIRQLRDGQLAFAARAINNGTTTIDDAVNTLTEAFSPTSRHAARSALRATLTALTEGTITPQQIRQLINRAATT